MTDLPSAARSLAEATRGHYDPDPEDLRTLLPVIDAVAAGAGDEGRVKRMMSTIARCDAGGFVDVWSAARAAIALADAERAAAVEERWRI